MGAYRTKTNHRHLLDHWVLTWDTYDPCFATEPTATIMIPRKISVVLTACTSVRKVQTCQLGKLSIQWYYHGRRWLWNSDGAHIRTEMQPSCGNSLAQSTFILSQFGDAIFPIPHVCCVVSGGRCSRMDAIQFFLTAQFFEANGAWGLNKMRNHRAKHLLWQLQLVGKLVCWHTNDPRMADENSPSAEVA